jgi:hypothetical protein
VAPPPHPITWSINKLRERCLRLLGPGYINPQTGRLYQDQWGVACMMLFALFPGYLIVWMKFGSETFTGFYLSRLSFTSNSFCLL